MKQTCVLAGAILLSIAGRVTCSGVRGGHGLHASSKVERLWPAWVKGLTKSWDLRDAGGLHEVVGEDGVWMISLEETPERYNYSTSALREVGVEATKFAATDVTKVSREQLDSSCPLRASAGGEADQEDQCVKAGKAGPGCESQIEQAIADSHRRALVEAHERDLPWTLIMEDDMIPVSTNSRWAEAFRDAWARVPPKARVVRLSWCTFLFNDTRTFANTKPFRLIDWVGRESDGVYQAGGCTGAYLVHREIIPRMLDVFPCCCGLDCCLAWDFYNKKDEDGKTVGEAVMLNMDAEGSTEFANGFTVANIKQSGIFVQDNRVLVSTRDP